MCLPASRSPHHTPGLAHQLKAHICMQESPVNMLAGTSSHAGGLPAAGADADPNGDSGDGIVSLVAGQARHPALHCAARRRNGAPSADAWKFLLSKACAALLFARGTLLPPVRMSVLQTSCRSQRKSRFDSATRLSVSQDLHDRHAQV